jgi:hypothetical protein
MPVKGRLRVRKGCTQYRNKLCHPAQGQSAPRAICLLPVPATNLDATRFAPSRCQGCGAIRQTKNVTFYRNVGMLVMRRTYKVHADLCRACIDKRFWEFTGKNLLLGA